MRSLSRAGFRNAALRLEVLSETIVEYARQRDRLAVRRQTREMRRVLDELAAYLAIANDRSLPEDARPITTTARRVPITPATPTATPRRPRPLLTPAATFTPMPTFTPLPTFTPPPSTTP